MDQRAGTPDIDRADIAVVAAQSGKPVGEKAADAATELYVSEERMNRKERFERVIRKATATS